MQPIKMSQCLLLAVIYYIGAALHMHDCVVAPTPP